ncbi:MAG: CaiB/BaiF CoA transferase family protein [Acidobacteriota bacterium]
MTPPAALDDVTVLDLSHALAGPFASTLLGYYGARIIKIEPPGSGDIARGWGPPFYGQDSAYFVSLHPNKQSVAIDLKHPEGRNLFHRLVAKADVVLENLRIGAAARLGLDYPSLSADHPRLIYCSVSGFGQDGPFRDRAALDLVVQAESGMISLTGPEGGPNVRCGVSIADFAAGMFAAFGILTALHARERTGRGQFVDVSMLEGQLSLLHGAIGSYFADHVLPRAWGTAYAALVPYQTFRTRSRDLAIGIGSDKLWRTLCPLLELPALATDPRYATNGARVTNRATLIATLQESFLQRTYEEWEALLLPAGIPVGAINTIGQVVQHPQVQARGALVDCEHPTAGTVRMVGPPVRLSETPGGVRSASPRLGEHTAAVLREQLDLGAGEIERLATLGVIGN